MDIYFPNGKWTKGVNDNEGRDLRGKLSNHLFRNNGDGTFTDVTSAGGARRARATRWAARRRITTTTATSICWC